MRLRGLISALALSSACGGLPEEAEPLGRQAECVVEGETDTGQIDVAAEGVRPFSVELNAPAWVRLTLASGPPAVVVRGPHLEFSGGGEAFPVHTFGPLVTMGGLVRLGSAMNLASAEVVGGHVLAAFEPRFQPRLSGVPVSCAWLAPGEAEEFVEPSEEPPADETLTTTGRPVLLPLSIHLTPDDARAVQLNAPQPEFLSLSMGEPSGGWRRARWHNDDITVDGWVRDGDVRETDLIGGMGGFGTSCCLGRSPEQIETWTLSEGTTIFAEPGRGPWARVHTPIEVQVEREPGARFGRVIEIPDLTTGCSRDNVWVDLGPVDR
jgi:hypothetical protein